MSPRSKAQFQQIRDASSRKILEAALELFGTKGYESTSINDIATMAGLSKGLMYHYFKGKEDLVEQLIKSLSMDAEGTVEGIIVEDPRESLRNILNLFFNEMRLNFNRWKLIMNLSVQIEKFDFVQEMAREKAEGYIMIMEDLFKQMQWPNPKDEARILGALFDGIGVQYFILKKDYQLDEMERILIKKYCQ